MAKVYEHEWQLEKDLKNVKKRSFIRVLLVVMVIFTGYLIFVEWQNMWMFGLSTILLLYIKYQSRIDKQRLARLDAGLQGEQSTLKVLECLPNDYSVFPDVKISVNSRESQLDYIVVGYNGVFVIEVKNMNGKIKGHYKDFDFIQSKMDHLGKKSERHFYSPIKQVSTHAYRLSRLLDENGLKVWIQGNVYFSNPKVELVIHNDSLVRIFSDAQNGKQQLIDSIRCNKPKIQMTSLQKKKIEDILIKFIENRETA